MKRLSDDPAVRLAECRGYVDPAPADEPVGLTQAFEEWYAANPYELLTHSTLAYMAFVAGSNYRHPQRPMVLPAHEQQDLRSPTYGYAKGWNACLDRIAELNK